MGVVSSRVWNDLGDPATYEGAMDRPALLDEDTWDEATGSSVRRFRRQLHAMLAADDASGRLSEYIVAPSGRSSGQMWFRSGFDGIVIEAYRPEPGLNRSERLVLHDLGFDDLDGADGDRSPSCAITYDLRDPESGWLLAADVIALGLSLAFGRIEPLHAPPFRLHLVPC
jgi:hypothetical protein